VDNRQKPTVEEILVQHLLRGKVTVDPKMGDWRRGESLHTHGTHVGHTNGRTTASSVPVCGLCSTLIFHELLCH
jgi:hypothetical protein